MDVMKNALGENILSAELKDDENLKQLGITFEDTEAPIYNDPYRGFPILSDDGEEEESQGFVISH